MSLSGTCPPHILYTYCGVIHPKSMEPERASFSINSRSLSVIISIFLSHKFLFCHTDLRSSFARLLPSGRKTVAQIFSSVPQRSSSTSLLKCPTISSRIISPKMLMLMKKRPFNFLNQSNLTYHSDAFQVAKVTTTYKPLL